MTYTIRLRRDWEIPSKSYKAGRYTVPTQMCEKDAERALRHGIAVKDMPVLSFKKRSKNAAG